MLESKSTKQRDHDEDVKKIAHIEAECDLQVERVKELESKLGYLEGELTSTKQEKVDLEKKLKKVEDEKTRLKSALNENNIELKELEKTLTGEVYIISCTVRWQGTWKLVHGCGESCRPEPKARWRHDSPQP